MKMMKSNAERYAERVKKMGPFELVGKGEQLPLVAFRLKGDHPYDEFDVASQLAAMRGWMVPAYHLPPDADKVKLMRVLCKLTLTHSLALRLGDDLEEACKVLEEKGGMHEAERKRVHTGTGY
jgi:glutamate decarboxylase